jgi:hypothetical protein
VADQAASLFGSCCFEEGDVKVTMGTGTFLNVNTGYKPQASVAGKVMFTYAKASSYLSPRYCYSVYIVAITVILWLLHDNDDSCQILYVSCYKQFSGSVQCCGSKNLIFDLNNSFSCQ